MKIVIKSQGGQEFADTVQRTKANWSVHVLHRNCILNHVTEGKAEGSVEVTVRQGRLRTQLLDDLKERRRYWELKEAALDRAVWKTRFGRSCYISDIVLALLSVVSNSHQPYCSDEHAAAGVRTSDVFYSSYLFTSRF
jgi:hypothetical protein